MTLDAIKPQTDASTGEGETDFQVPDNKAQIRYKSGISGKLTFERVNEITWKLTDGSMTNVPACYGKWPGYRVSKTVASVIDVGVSKPAWLARFKDQYCGPLPLKEAKAAALKMAKGGKGDYRASDPIKELHDLTTIIERQQRGGGCLNDH